MTLFASSHQASVRFVYVAAGARLVIHARMQVMNKERFMVTVCSLLIIPTIPVGLMAL